MANKKPCLGEQMANAKPVAIIVVKKAKPKKKGK